MKKEQIGKIRQNIKNISGKVDKTERRQQIQLIFPLYFPKTSSDSERRNIN